MSRVLRRCRAVNISNVECRRVIVPNEVRSKSRAEGSRARQVNSRNAACDLLRESDFRCHARIDQRLNAADAFARSSGKVPILWGERRSIRRVGPQLDAEPPRQLPGRRRAQGLAENVGARPRERGPPGVPEGAGGVPGEAQPGLARPGRALSRSLRAPRRAARECPCLSRSRWRECPGVPPAACAPPPRSARAHRRVRSP
jgi:hypothetical protein